MGGIPDPYEEGSDAMSRGMTSPKPSINYEHTKEEYDKKRVSSPEFHIELPSVNFC